MATNQTCYLTQLVYWNGFDGFEYSSIFRDLVNDMQCFIDIGANTGYYSIAAATLNSKIQVHAFEPAYGPLHYLKTNVALNDLEDRLHVSDLALSDQQGSIKFFETGSRKFPWVRHVLAGDGSLLRSDDRAVVMERDVRMDTLDHYVKKYDIRNVDLIKVDTEGTEPSILDGAEETISRDMPIIICETLYNTTESELDRRLKAWGYVIYKHLPNGLERASALERAKDDGVRNCFFVHSSREGVLARFMSTSTKA